MKKYLPIILILASIALPAQAKDGYSLFYQVGGSLPELTGLTTPAQSKAGAWQWSQGGGIALESQKVYLSWSGSSLFGEVFKNNDDILSVKGDYGLFQVGYMVLDLPQFQIYPYAGAGLSGFVLRSTQDLSLSQNVSQGKLPLTKMNGQAWIFDAGLGMQSKIPTEDNQFLLLGVKAGYLFSPFDVSWSSNELPVNGGPQIVPDGFYAKLILGFGSSN